MEVGEVFVALAFIIAFLVISVVWITAPRQARLRSSPEDKRELEELKKRMGEMENRILTLQDLVIGGNYDMKRKLEQAEAAHLHNPASQAPETPRKLLEG
jgi:hypothetical protein